MGWLSDLVWDIVDEVTDPSHIITDYDGIGGDTPGRKEQRKKMNREVRRALGLQGMEGRNIIDIFTNKQVYPVEGSIVSCLLGPADHSGVYVGNNTIIHRDGRGFIAEVSPREFIERLDGWNPAVTIFVSCRGNDPVGSHEAAQRAREALHDPEHEGYHLLAKNCHQFCHYCLTGRIDNGATDFTFNSLENELRRVLNANSWRSWRLPDLFK